MRADVRHHHEIGLSFRAETLEYFSGSRMREELQFLPPRALVDGAAELMDRGI